MDFTRALPRLKRPLVFILPDGWRGDVVDLSATGLRLQTVAVLQPNLLIEGKLIIDESRQIPLKGTVIWTSPPDHRGFVPAELGLQLIDPPAEYLQALAQLFAD